MSKRTKTIPTNSQPAHASSPSRVATSPPSAPVCETQRAAPNPHPRIPLQLPSMTPDQAYLLLDAIEWLHAAIWNTHEVALVDLIINRVDSTPESNTSDTPSDDIPF